MARAPARWLLKSEPDAHIVKGVDLSYPYARLLQAPPRAAADDGKAPEPGRGSAHHGVFTGVRNYCARNYLRDRIAPGDTAFYYHSSCKVPAIVGIVEVVGPAVPDPSAADAAHPLYDAKHTLDAPRWFEIPIRAVRELQPPVTLAMLREHAAELEGLPLLRQPRLSVQPVTEEQWQTILGLEARLAPRAGACTSTAVDGVACSSESERSCMLTSRRKRSAGGVAAPSAESEHEKEATQRAADDGSIAAVATPGFKRRRNVRAECAETLAHVHGADSNLASARTRARARKPTD